MNVSVYNQGQLLQDKKLILRLYATKGGLYIDLLSIASLILFRRRQLFFSCVYQEEYVVLDYFKYVIFLRLKKVGKFLKFIKKEFDLIKNYIDLFRLFFILLVIAHLIACIWITISIYTKELYEDTWIRVQQLSDSHWSVIYIYSLYYAVMTMTTIGYGDIVPENPLEALFSIIIMVSKYHNIYQFFSSGFFAYTLNTITQILISISNEQKSYKEEMEVIESYMRKKRINFDLQKRVKSYLKSLWEAGLGDKNSQEQEDRVISKLNDKLQKELLLEDKGKIFLDQKVFKENFSKPFILKLIEKLKEIRLQPNEEVDNLTLKSTNNFYYVHSGRVDFIFKKSVMKSKEKQRIQIQGVRHLEILNLWQGKCFGVQYLFGRHENCKFSIKSSDFTILYYLSPQDIEEVIQSKEFRHTCDNENYCKLKDKLLLYGRKSELGLICTGCYQKGHEVFQCRDYQFIPIKKRVIDKLEYSRAQSRQFFKRNLNKSNCLVMMKDIEEIALEMQQDFLGNDSIVDSDQSWGINEEGGDQQKVIDFALPTQRGKKKIDKIEQPQNFIIRSKNHRFTTNQIRQNGRKQTYASSNFFQEIVQKSSEKNQNQIEFDKVREYLKYFPHNNVSRVLKKIKQEKIRAKRRLNIFQS